MIIKKVLIGNEKEAFIEDNFASGLNIISSDDNNKGKTIVIQSLMYALGNNPIFPSGIEADEYYHIVNIEIDNKDFIIARNKNAFIVKENNDINIFDTVSEFKHFVHKNLFQLPIIMKDNIKRMVDPSLYYQLFFIGQDKRDTSNIIKKGQYNKEDYYNMIYSITGLDYDEETIEDEEKLKEKINQLNEEKKTLEKQCTILKSKKPAIAIVAMNSDNINFGEKILKINFYKNKISDLINSRNRMLGRKVKNEMALNEMQSLNNTIKTGKLECLECGSYKIGFTNEDRTYTFDVSSIEIRQSILNSIKEKIEIFEEEIEKLTEEININQQQMQNLLNDQEISLENILIYKDKLYDIGHIDAKLKEIKKEIKSNKEKLEKKSNFKEDNKILQTEIIKKIVNTMNDFYKYIDPASNKIYEDLFTKNEKIVYSGSEGTEFYLAKLYANAIVLKHNFPIVIDSFRAEELSSIKEKLSIEMYEKLNNQVIFTATLKNEELGKYSNMRGVNHIDYFNNEPYHLLNSSYVDEFKKELNKLLIEI